MKDKIKLVNILPYCMASDELKKSKDYAHNHYINMDAVVYFISFSEGIALYSSDGELTKLINDQKTVDFLKKYFEFEG